MFLPLSGSSLRLPLPHGSRQCTANYLSLSTLGYRHSLSSGVPHSGPSPSSHPGHILGPAFHGSLVQCRDPPEIPSAETPCTPCSIPGRESCSWHSSPPGVCALLLHTVSLVFLILQLSLICVLGTLSLVSRHRRLLSSFSAVFPGSLSNPAFPDSSKWFSSCTSPEHLVLWGDPPQSIHRVGLLVILSTQISQVP